MASEVSKKLPQSYDPSIVEAPRDGVFSYQDGVVSFLRLKVTPFSRVWMFDKYWHGRHLKRQIGPVNLISLPEARLRAYEWARQLTEGVLPPTLEQRQEATAKHVMTVASVFKQYYEQHVSINCRTADHIYKAFELYWKPIASIQLISLTPATVRQWLNRLAADRGKATANKQFASLRASVKWASDMGIIKLAHDPFLGVKSFKTEVQTHYLKPGDEFARLEIALQNESRDVRDAIMLLLWTGQRKSNVLSMEWSEIDFDASTWHIPPGKTKSKKQYSIGLTKNALLILEKRDKIGRFVFPCVREAGTPHLANINKVWLRIRKQAGLDHLRIHDLRHTTATMLANSGASAFEIQQALQHSSVRTTERYVHLVSSSVRSALEHSQKEYASN